MCWVTALLGTQQGLRPYLFYSSYSAHCRLGTAPALLGVEKGLLLWETGGCMEERLNSSITRQDCSGAKCPNPRKMERNRGSWEDAAVSFQDRLVLLRDPNFIFLLCFNLWQTLLTVPAALVLGNPYEIPWDPWGNNIQVPGVVDCLKPILIG